MHMVQLHTHGQNTPTQKIKTSISIFKQFSLRGCIKIPDHCVFYFIHMHTCSRRHKWGKNAERCVGIQIVTPRMLTEIIAHLVKEDWLAHFVTLNCLSPILISIPHLVFLSLPGFLFVLILSLVLKRKVPLGSKEQFTCTAEHPRQLTLYSPSSTAH